MITKEIRINGHIAKGYEIGLPNTKLILVKADKGYVMCGYLSSEAAENFNDCAAIVKGVKSIDDMLAKQIVWSSKAAAIAGVKPGMTGLEAISLMF